MRILTVHEGSPERTSFPWLSAVVFSLLFFLATQSLILSDTFRANRFINTLDEAQMMVVEGDIYHRMAFLTWGLYALGLLVLRAPASLRPAGVLSVLLASQVGFTLLSVFWSDETWLSAKREFVFLANWIAAVAFIRRYGVEVIPKLAVFASGTYLLIGVASEFVVGSLHPFTTDYRFAGTMHPNQQGLNCAILALGCSFLSYRDRTIRFRVSFALASWVAVSFLLLTKSRTAAGCWLATYMLLRLALSKHRSLLAYSLVGAAVLAAVLWILVGLPHVLIDMAMMGRGEETGADLTGRLPLWNYLMTFVSLRPILGYGFGAFWNSSRMDAIVASSSWSVTEAHSAYMEWLLAGGMVGLFLYVSMITAAICQSWRRCVRERQVDYAFVVTMICLTALQCLTESSVAWQIPLTFYLNLSVVATATVRVFNDRDNRMSYSRRAGT